MSKAISVSTGPIFTIRFFSPNGRYLHVFSRSGPVFPIPQGTLPWQPICGKINYPSALIALLFWNGMGYRYLNERVNSVNDVWKCEIRSVVFELKWGRKWKLCCDSSEISRFSLIWHTGVLKRIRTSQFWFQQVKRQSFLYIWWKFGEIQISDPRVLGEKSCTAEVDNCYHA